MYLEPCGDSKYSYANIPHRKAKTVQYGQYTATLLHCKILATMQYEAPHIQPTIVQLAHCSTTITMHHCRESQHIAGKPSDCIAVPFLHSSSAGTLQYITAQLRNFRTA